MATCICGLHSAAGRRRRPSKSLWVDWRQRGHGGWTPLMEAAANGLVKCMEELLKHSPDEQVLMKDNSGSTALILAVCAGRDDCARQLLQHGNTEAQVAAAKDDGTTPLMAATLFGHVACVRLLLQHGDATAQTTVANQDGHTPLMVAALLGRVACAELLLQHGDAAAQVALVNSEGFTALMCTALSGHEACMRLLLQHGDAAAQVAHSDCEGATTLMFLALRGHEACMRLLLQRGDARQQVAACDNSGFTPLMFAAQRGHCACMQLLLQHGDMAAQTAAGNKWGDTALMAAAAWGGHEPCTRLLLQHGDVAAQLAAVNVVGLTPLLYTLRHLNAADRDEDKANRLRQCALLLLARGGSLGPAATTRDYVALLSMLMLQDRMALAMAPDMCSELAEQLRGQGGRGAGVAKWGPALRAGPQEAASIGLGKGDLLLPAVRAMATCKVGSASAAQHRCCVEALLMKGAVMGGEATEDDHAALLPIIQQRLALAQDPSWCNEAVVNLVVAIGPSKPSSQQAVGYIL